MVSFAVSDVNNRIYNSSNCFHEATNDISRLKKIIAKFGKFYLTPLVMRQEVLTLKLLIANRQSIK